MAEGGNALGRGGGEKVGDGEGGCMFQFHDEKLWIKYLNPSNILVSFQFGLNPFKHFKQAPNIKNVISVKPYLIFQS